MIVSVLCSVCSSVEEFSQSRKSSSPMATTLETISVALQQIDSKKSDLKKAFDDLQSQSSSLLSSFSLSWSDLDSYFTSLQTSLTEKFRVLQTLESQSTGRPGDVPEPLAQAAAEPVADGEPEPVPPRPELVAFCEKMDGIGLRKYVSETSKERNAVRAELPSALRRAPDPAAMVLDSMEGFYGEKYRRKGDKDVEFNGLRRSCVLLLEQLMALRPIIRGDVRERAKVLAMEWKGKIGRDEENQLESLGFLHLVAAYGLVSEFSSDEIVDNFVVIARHRQAIELFRKMASNKAEDLVRKLVSKGKQLLAIKFSFEFELTDRFPPVPLLKDYVKESKKIAKKVCKEGRNSLKSLNEATAKETSALKSVIKIIEERKLESEYPKESLEKRIAVLEKQKVDRKRPPVATVAKIPQPQYQPTKQQQGKDKQKQQSGNKRLRVDAPLGPTPFPKNFRGANTAVPSYQPSHFQSTGLLADSRAPYASTSASPYGISGLVPSANPYAGSSAGIYGLEGNSTSVPGNPTLAGSHLYMAEPYGQSAYYDRSTSYGGYDLGPEYHTAYYPQ